MTGNFILFRRNTNVSVKGKNNKLICKKDEVIIKNLRSSQVEFD